MNTLTIDELDARSDIVETTIDLTEDIDRWCSGPDWVLSVHAGFAPDAEAFLVDVSDEAADRSDPACRELVDDSRVRGFGLFARYRLADERTMLGGLEPMWGFASPIVANDPSVVAARIADAIVENQPTDLIMLPGMPRPTGPDGFTAAVVREIAHLGTVKAGEGITRQVADIADGYDAWIARRTSRFRRNLRAINDRAKTEGVELVDVAGDEDVFHRLMGIEELTWKAADNSGITSPDMSVTYQTMVARLAKKGRLRAHIARLGGHDIGYILGGVRAGRYRGLQLSYVADAAELSVGHLLQDHQLRLLTTTGEATTYDLGMDLEYKRRWADEAVSSITIVIERGQ